MVRQTASTAAPEPSRPSTPSPGGEDVEEVPYFDNVDELQQHVSAYRAIFG